MRMILINYFIFNLNRFVSQTCYAPVFLEKAGTTTDKLEALKLVIILKYKILLLKMVNKLKKKNKINLNLIDNSFRNFNSPFSCSSA